MQICKAKQKDKTCRLSDELGLRLAVKPTGSKLWQFRYRYLGKERLLSIGQYPIISPVDARQKRDQAERLLSNGIDPSTQKQLDQIDSAVKVRMTFTQVADEY